MNKHDVAAMLALLARAVVALESQNPAKPTAVAPLQKKKEQKVK